MTMPNKNSIESEIEVILELFENELSGKFGDKITKDEATLELKNLIQREVKKGRVEELKELLKPTKCYRPWCKVEHTNLRKRYVLDRLEELEG